MKPHNIELMSIIIPFSNIKMGDFLLPASHCSTICSFRVLLLCSEWEEVDPPTDIIAPRLILILPSSEEYSTQMIVIVASVLQGGQ